MRFVDALVQNDEFELFCGSSTTAGLANSVENVFDDDDLELMGGYLDLE